MRRRDFIVGNSALLTACNSDDIAAPRRVVKPVEPKPRPKPTPAEEDPPKAKEDHAGHGDHANHAGHVAADEDLLAAARICIEKGQLCQAHCHVLLGQGDTSMVECTKAVTDMIAVTQALSALAAAASPSLRAQAGVAREVCSRCQEACEVHAAKHPTCRNCAAACGDALASYTRLLG
jgi:Cys-rich four helix bundle protein (predicted Tat secretion target)